MLQAPVHIVTIKKNFTGQTKFPGLWYLGLKLQYTSLSTIVLFKIIGARVSVYGSLNFLRNGNVALDSGALYVTSLGQVELFPGARMNFTSNSGK